MKFRIPDTVIMKRWSQCHE